MENPKNKEVLNDINLHIKSGQTVGIIGATGSAKSSLVQLIPRLYDVTSGSLKVGGTDVKDYHIESLRNQVSMVLQKNTLFSGTIAENLRWGNENATDEELRHACKLACADEFIDKFEDGYETYIEQGRKQRLRGSETETVYSQSAFEKSQRYSSSTILPAQWI